MKAELIFGNRGYSVSISSSDGTCESTSESEGESARALALLEACSRSAIAQAYYHRTALVWRGGSGRAKSKLQFRMSMTC
jgi:hypothetical protein